MYKSIAFLRSSLFWLVFLVSTIIFAPLSLLTFPFSVLNRYRFIILWSRFNIWWLKLTCGLKFEVIGKENIPEGGMIFLAKHQSTWETMAFQQILPPHVWVLKRELFKIPFFGWGLKMLKPIAIDRTAGRRAVDQLVDQGIKKLASGWSVMIFPEGTRVLPGKEVRYKLGGSILSSQANYPVVPIAHNAGEFWPKHSYIKWPGTISVVIGEPINAYGRKPEEINQQIHQWIETQMTVISEPSRWGR
ncbi:MAG: 1-acyl-sn-glycerol-3-phosphate acyltransferase [Gammaproteobacteria bacterium]|nr:1-acyl-sn-glycerol-3-phosphate acyltransferase [Gammaproteobacteria bacterium]